MKTIKLSDSEIERLIKLLNKRIEWNKDFDPNYRLPYVQQDPKLIKKLREEKKRRDGIVEQYRGIIAKLN